MEITVESIPLNFPRTWFPFENTTRFITWILVIEFINISAGYVLNIHGLTNHLFYFFIAFFCSLSVLHGLAPVRLTISGIPKSNAINNVSPHLEHTRFFFTYLKNSSNSEWKYSRSNFIYPWDPTIRIDETKSNLVLVGPYMVLMGLSKILEKEKFK